MDEDKSEREEAKRKNMASEQNLLKDEFRCYKDDIFGRIDEDGATCQKVLLLVVRIFHPSAFKVTLAWKMRTIYTGRVVQAEEQVTELVYEMHYFQPKISAQLYTA